MKLSGFREIQPKKTVVDNYFCAKVISDESDLYAV